MDGGSVGLGPSMLGLRPAVFESIWTVGKGQFGYNCCVEESVILVMKRGPLIVTASDFPLTGKGKGRSLTVLDDEDYTRWMMRIKG